MSRPTIQLTGDGLAGAYMTWEVHGQPGSIRCALRDPRRIARAVGRLTSALPDTDPDPHQTQPPLPERWALRGHDPEIRRLHSALAGPLSDPAAEFRLLADLSGALLPPDFVADLLRLRSRDDTPLLKLAPSPIAARVPWGLLPIDEQCRLIDVCDIVMVAPLVERDLHPRDPRPWSETRKRPCLHVIDPYPSTVTPAGLRRSRLQVLDGDPVNHWMRHAAEAAHQGCSCQAPITRIVLSDLLQVPRSRFFFVGHVDQVRGPEGLERSAGMRLHEDSQAYSLSNTLGARPRLTDADLIRGIPIRRQDGPNPDDRLVPALAEDNNRNVPGPELWPMPPRVALIACGSGVDLTLTEPLGLATAMVLAGAELVTATLWSLPTDQTYAAYADPPRFSDLVQAVDEIQQTDDPISELSAWQRERLVAWRKSAHRKDSPLWWAGLVNFHAPNRLVTED